MKNLSKLIKETKEIKPMPKSKITLGLLEFGYSDAISNPMSVIENVINYCELADQLNFNQFWLTEHHNFYSHSPWSSPEILLPILLCRTEKIRIGSGGVLINYHSPYRVALNFRLLENIFPNRVDLGFSNGHPQKNISELLKQKKIRTLPEDYFPNIKMISELFHNEVENVVDKKILIPPFKGITPDLYLLSSSFKNLNKAVELKLNLCKSLFQNADSINEELDLLDKYREGFYSKHGVQPKISLSASFICSKTDRLAKRIFEKRRDETVFNQQIGSSSFIHDNIAAMSEKFSIKNFILTDLSNNFKVKMEGAELLSKEFNL